MTLAPKKQSGLQKLDYRVFKYSTILLVALVIPFNAIHEFGHLIPCYLTGFEGTMSVGLMGSFATCNGLQGSLLFAFTGGFFALMVAFVPLLFTKIRKNPIFLIVLGSFGIAHFMTALLETFARDFYMSSEAMIPISMISFVLFAVLLSIFGKTEIAERQIGNHKGLISK